MKSGTSLKPKFVPVHNINLSDEIRKSILQFHSLTGSDTTSQFAGIGKKSAWKVYCDRNEKLVEKLGEQPICNSQVQSDVEAFICKLYCPETSVTDIQKIRSSMFRKSKKTLENIPPTHDALKLHIKRSHFQAFVWRHSLIAEPDVPSPLLCGWKKDGDLLKPLLMNQDAVPANYLQLTSCGCSQAGQCRTRRCLCRKAGIPCTAICKCSHDDHHENIEDWCKNPFNPSESRD